MDDNVQVDFDPFRSGEISRKAPSTEPQQEILTSALLGDEANTAFNEAVSLRITGPLKPGVVEIALQSVIARHDALRMTFTPAGNEICVTDDVDFKLGVRDLTGLSDAEQEAEIQALWVELANKPMDLFEGPLFFGIWLQLAEECSELVLLAHHAICDGWSFYVILNELGQILSGDESKLSNSPSSFADFAELQEASAASNQDIDYWLERFKNLPPPLDLPLDRPRPALRTFAASRFDYRFDGDLVTAIRSTAGGLKASIVNVVLAGVAVLLHRLCQADDLAIGLPVARQSTDGKADLVGHGVQLLPVRIGITPEEKFSDIVARAKSAVLDASDHPKFTFGSLIRELKLSGDPSRVPLVPVIFNIDQPFDKVQLGPGAASVRTVPRAAENFEIFLNVLPSDDAMVVEATYNTELYDQESIESWMQALECILHDVAGEPGKSIEDICLSKRMPECYDALNSTLREHHHEHWLSGLEQNVKQSPDSPAVFDELGCISFGEFDKQSSQLAAALIDKGIGRGDHVGIYMRRSRHLLVTVAAVHKAGAAYVPLDPSFPESRLVYMLQDSGASLIITDIELPKSLGDTGIQVLSAPLDGDQPAGKNLPEPADDDIAYVIYTSGSTGNPKGVKVQHSAVANFLSSMATKPGIAASDKLLAVTTLSFDISVLELLLPLFSGASVYIATRDQAGDSRMLSDLMAEEQISVMQATPATWRLLLADGWTGDKELKVLCGGEALPADLAKQLVGKVGELWNMYGPTETTIWSTCKLVDTNFTRITVGAPIDNTDIYILDNRSELLPASVPGELCIGGRGVALGYHNLADLTAEKFADIPRLGRIYRTGDRARILPDGDIEHLGRIDDQVKVRGFRIELGEIESVLEMHLNVEQAAVYVWNAREHDSRIVACCVATTGKNLSPIALRKHIRASVPEYMVPQHFLSVDTIPLTPNGKVDRRNLPSPVVSDSQLGSGTIEQPETPAEVVIADIWTKLIQPVRAVGRHDLFFEIGGHSLLALDALRQIEGRFGTRLDPRILFQKDLAAIASNCGAAAAEDAEDARPTKVADGTRRLLTENQERILKDCIADPDTLRYHITFTFKILGDLDVDCFQTALQQVFAQNELLRASFQNDKDGFFLQINPLSEACVLERHDLSAADKSDEAVMAKLVALSKRPIDVQKGPLAAMHLVDLGDDGHVFFLVPHHLVFDGWSFDIFLRELGETYEALSQGKTIASDDSALDFSDFSTWQRGRDDASGDSGTEKYWSSELRQLPPPIAWPGRESGADAPISREQFFVDRDTMQQLEKACDRYAAKMPDILLAALLAALSRATGRSDQLVGLATAGRFLPEVANMIGPFFSNLPTRFRSIELDDVGQFLSYVGSRVKESSGHQDISENRLLALADTDDNIEKDCLYQVTYSYQEAGGRALAFAGLDLKQISVSRPDIDNDIDFWVRNTRDGLVASLDYRSSIAEPDVIRLLQRDYVAALHGIIAGQFGNISWASDGTLGHRGASASNDSGVRKSGLFGRLLQGKQNS